MEVTQDNTAMLPPGDLDKLDKRAREEFHSFQENIVQHLLKASNDFQLRFPGLRVEWRFQTEVYQSVQQKSSTIRYGPRMY